MAGIPFGEPITIRYDGLDADEHTIELVALGQSIQGVGRIIGVAANFAATSKFVKHQDALSVRVVATPPQAHCFEITAILQWLDQSSTVSSIVGGLTVTLVSYVFAKLAGNKAEMKELRAALEVAIRELGNRDQKIIDRLLDTVDQMASSLKPAAKQAVTPIGKTASTLTISGAGKQSIPVGVAEKEAIESVEPPEISEETTFTVRFHEMNFDNKSCRVSFHDDPDTEQRTSATITDPAAMLPNNPYAQAFASQLYISVKGKAAFRNGEIEKLYISDISR